VQVGKGSPAQRSGISAGDVIVEADKAELKDWDDLQHIIKNKKVGDNIELTITRGKDNGKVSVVLNEAPS
jgi:S1-C subfamily serine protease